MNGRLYDPMLHRFLSPDNFVQDPFNTQNFNRYGYVLNNPLMYTDPSGEIIPLLLIGAAIVGAYIGGAQANGSWNPTKWNWNSTSTWGGIVGGGLIGVVSMGAGIAASAALAPAAMAMVGVSGGAVGGAISGFIGGVVGGAISGGGMAIMPGGDGKFFSGMLKGAIVGGLSGAVLGGVVGGVTTPKSHSWLTGNPHRAPVSSVSELSSIGVKESHGLSKGEFYNGKITSEVNGDFQQAMREWNGIQRQYGIEPSQTFPNSFNTTLGNGSTITGNFYSGGTTNPNGFTIKIFTYIDKAIIPAVKKIPPVYIRY